MIYINTVKFPEADNNSIYPDSVFYKTGLSFMHFSNITILYGNNGSGKSTILNVISELINAERKKGIFKDVHYDEYMASYIPFDSFVSGCRLGFNSDDEGNEIPLPKIRRVITSDDIFKNINDRITYNDIAVKEKQEKIDEARHYRHGVLLSDYHFPGLDDYDYLKDLLDAKQGSYHSYSNARSRTKKRMESNGETALSYFSSVIESDGIYLLDEPENCLSPLFQLELMKIIAEAARFLGCQFIIATHSPLILSLDGAMIYDLDSCPSKVQEWENLDNVRVYYEFFKRHKDKFEKPKTAEKRSEKPKPIDKAKLVLDHLKALGVDIRVILRACDIDHLEKSYIVIKNNPNITKDEFIDKVFKSNKRSSK